MKRWEYFTKEQIEQFVKDSASYRSLAEKCGYNPDGGSTNKTMKEMIEFYHLDTSHFTGQGWNKNNYNYDRFTKGHVIKAANALPALINIRGRKCENCGLENWLNQPITLEVHHIDGDKLNNDLNNLLLLCPNCHSYTETWRGKNISHKLEDTVSEEEYVKALQQASNIRQALLSLGLTAKGANYTRARELINKYNIEHLLNKDGRKKRITSIFRLGYFYIYSAAGPYWTCILFSHGCVGSAARRIS